MSSRVDAAGLGAQDGDGDGGGAVPVGIEVVRGRVQEGVTRQVDRPAPTGPGVGVGVHRLGEAVGRQDVHAAVAHERRDVPHRVEDPLEAGPRGEGACAGTAHLRGAVGRRGEARQVLTFGIVELQGPGDRIEHDVGDAGKVAPLEAGVVLDGHVGEHRDLGPPQPGHAAVPAGRDAGLVGRELRAAGSEELAHLLLDVHVLDATPGLRKQGRPGGTPQVRPSPASNLGCPGGAPHGRNSPGRANGRCLWW